MKRRQTMFLETSSCPRTSLAIPALRPLMPACLKPFFLIMKLEPIKRDELTARASPLAWSVDHRPPFRDPRSTPAARIPVCFLTSPRCYDEKLLTQSSRAVRRALCDLL